MSLLTKPTTLSQMKLVALAGATSPLAPPAGLAITTIMPPNNTDTIYNNHFIYRPQSPANC